MFQSLKNMNYAIKVIPDSNKENISPYIIRKNSNTQRRRNKNKDFGVLSDITSKVLRNKKRSDLKKIIKLY